MTKYKVCILGAFAVGKTSLVQRYVSSIFSEKYQTTLGVKIDQKTVSVANQSIDLVLWDLAGEDDFIKVRSSYLRGSAGAILVADGSRAETLDVVIELKDKLYEEVGEVPIVVIINKSDIREQWRIEKQKLDPVVEAGCPVLETSAKDGFNVENAFQALAQQLLGVRSA